MMQDTHLQKMLFIMRLVFVFIVASGLTVFASESYSQVTRISLNMQNVTIKDALKAIENSTSFTTMSWLMSTGGWMSTCQTKK